MTVAGSRKRPSRLSDLAPFGSDAISVVISTFERPDACERALRSTLAQTESPLEVLVCDNGSTDETEARMRDWERRDERVRYLRTSRNSGTPAITRNLGIEHARGDWIAFLDDDDEWLPGKLAAQRVALATEAADVIATNALRSDGSIYFTDASIWRPKRLDLLKANPIVMSSALVRRERLLSVGGFPTDIRVKEPEDYAIWLELAGRGARFLILGEVLVRYEDASDDRLSLDRARIQLGVTRLVWKHALRAPVCLAGIKVALRSSVAVGHVLAAEVWAGLRVRRQNRAGGGRSRVSRGAGR